MAGGEETGGREYSQKMSLDLEESIDKKYSGVKKIARFW